MASEEPDPRNVKPPSAEETRRVRERAKLPTFEGSAEDRAKRIKDFIEAKAKQAKAQLEARAKELEERKPKENMKKEDADGASETQA